MADKLLAFCLLVLLPRSSDTAKINYQNGCPTGCHCELTDFRSRFNVSCSNGRPRVDAEQFAHQLDTMLSSDQIVERLTSLSITNTPLTRVPASVCQLLNLTSLNLEKTISPNCRIIASLSWRSWWVLVQKTTQSLVYRTGCSTVSRVLHLCAFSKTKSLLLDCDCSQTLRI